MHYLLIYELNDDYMERRGAFRAEHLALAKDLVDRGLLVLGGALSEPADQAVLVFRCDDPTPIEAFVTQDPYVSHGLVRKWRIRPWTAVVGTALPAS
jgi:uncharacterized protein YciI